MKPGTPTFNGERLREAREARGFTCQSLADELKKISRSSISNYENGLNTPSPDVLQLLADCLHVAPHYFTRRVLATETCAKFFRSFQSATAKARTMVNRRYEWFREIFVYLHQFIVFPEMDVPTFDLPSDYESLSLEDVEEFATQLRAFWKLGERPISNVVWLLEAKGVICARFRFGSGSLDAFSEWRGTRPCVILSSDKNCAVRSRYDAAHELAHMLIHKSIDPKQLVDVGRFSTVERQADRFANAFLLPERPFANDFIPSLDYLRTLKAKWRVSIAAMIYRARVLNLISEQKERNLWRGMASRKWRTREPFDNDYAPERPEFIRKSIALLAREGISSFPDIAFQLGIDISDVRELSGFEVDDAQPNIANMQDPGPAEEDEITIIPFTKQA